jgi:hypothetical protein
MRVQILNKTYSHFDLSNNYDNAFVSIIQCNYIHKNYLIYIKYLSAIESIYQIMLTLNDISSKSTLRYSEIWIDKLC